MNGKLWSSHQATKEAALAHRSGEVCLDNAFVLIEGHPDFAWLVNKAQGRTVGAVFS